MDEIIIKFIQRKFPEVSDVWINTHKVMLGWKTGSPIIDRKRIHVSIDNTKNRFDYQQLLKIASEIQNSTKKYFGLGSNPDEEYNPDTDYDWDIQQIARVTLHTEI